MKSTNSNSSNLYTLLSTTNEFTVETLSKLICEHVHCDERCLVNETFFFGDGLYALTDDLKNHKVVFPYTVNPQNPRYSFFSPKYIASYLHILLYKINGCIEISTPSGSKIIQFQRSYDDQHADYLKGEAAEQELKQRIANPKTKHNPNFKKLKSQIIKDDAGYIFIATDQQKANFIDSIGWARSYSKRQVLRCLVAVIRHPENTEWAEEFTL